ncbi:UNVERIFIED_CONTAM: hypothetical protein Sangu_1659600 [Sesamum angustifolium]|uniref:Uncharacterized protein n=1 Tax=Sesamum angustifolium TaxID=2727405 RepID=A0AAW2MJ04_9LAMI
MYQEVSAGEPATRFSVLIGLRSCDSFPCVFVWYSPALTSADCFPALQKTVKNGLHILLGGISALALVVFFRFFVLTRIKYGPARYWAILFIFWFLVFGIWASRTHGARAT